MEPKITSVDLMNHYASVFGKSKQKILDEWCEYSRNDSLLTNKWVFKTDAFNILFGERRQTKDMNLIDAWA